jgi:hypothetical protein
MNTNPFSTARHQAIAFAGALALTLTMLLGVNGLAAQGAAEAQMAAAATLVVSAPRAASGV